MKIPKAKAIQLIDERIFLFRKIITEAKYENRFNDDYVYTYNGTKDLLTELFSKDIAKEFEEEVSTHSPISILGDDISPHELLQDYKEHINRCIIQLTVYKERIHNFWPDDDKDSAQLSKKMKQDGEEMKSEKKVFVVHGRNEEARIAMFDFLRSLGLEPIEWSEAVSFTGKGSPHIGEILDHAFKIAQAVIVLLTGDDIAKLCDEFIKADDPPYEKEMTPQARPNVLFEAGLAFGRQPDRTILITLGYVRPFSDVAGRNIVKISNRGEDRQNLISRLKTAGCKFDTDSKTDWLSKGDFDLALNIHKEALENEIKSHRKTHESNTEAVRMKDTPSDILDEIEIKVLILLAEIEKTGAHSIEDLRIASILKVDLTFLRYHLENLKKKDYVAAHLSMRKPTGYSIRHKGREYLVKNNVINN